MRRTDWTWAYWGLFGLGLSTVAALSLLIVWRVRSAYYAERLTRETLADALVLSLGILLCLLLAGWAYTSRPKRSTQSDEDPLWS